MQNKSERFDNSFTQKVNSSFKLSKLTLFKIYLASG